jgi:hypothetical protein
MDVPRLSEEDHEPVQPTLGRVVHYRAHGSLDGRYPPTCRTAHVTEVPALLPEQPNEGPPGYVKSVRLAVLNPSGLFFGERPHHHDPTATKAGSWHWTTECPDGL